VDFWRQVHTTESQYSEADEEQADDDAFFALLFGKIGKRGMGMGSDKGWYQPVENGQQQ